MWSRMGFGKKKEETMEPRKLVACSGTLYILFKVYEPLGGKNSEGNYVISIEEEENPRCPRYSMVVREDGEEMVRQPIGNGLTLAYTECSVHWTAYVDGKLQSLAFKFGDEDAKLNATVMCDRFVCMYNRCTYALMTGTDVDSTNPEDESYEYLSSTAVSRLPGESREDPVYELDVNHESKKATGVGNVCHSESMQFDRALVVRKERNGFEFQAHAFDEDGFSRKAAEKFTLGGISSCEKALLDDTETKMLLLSVDDNKIRELDVEYGKIVENFEMPVPVRGVTYGAYEATPQPVYTCLGNNVAFNMDLRMDPRKNIVAEPGNTLNDYKLSIRKPFTCHATSASGHLVIGDSVGAIRLYTGPPGSRRPDGKYNPKTAKTLLDTKVPIVAVDVTADGEYVLAVCEKFLLLMRTVFKDESKPASNGFVSRMGKNKPNPLRLQPTTAQIEAIGGIERLNFTSGGFDRFNKDHESCITASSGSYVFTWSLEGAKKALDDGRACIGESAKVAKDVITVSARVPEKVIYMTDHDIHMAPLKQHTRTEKGAKEYRYM